MHCADMATPDQVRLFGGLTDEQRANLNDLCLRDEALRSYACGECIMAQGEEGDEFFVR